jgi:eukaryotic-like serine/threonine-protein kinase
VLEKIGAGGMGEVYLAHDTRLNRQVALKALTGSEPAGDIRRRLRREAQAAARLNHPGIAAIHDVLDDGDRCYIVMEYVQGRSLDALSDARMPIERALDIAAQLADALAYAHERGVVHRDVKPANVRVRPDGSAKLLDLGLARVTVADGASAGLTATATIQGTPSYMAPEQLTGTAVDARADIYSLGALLFEVLAGRPPFLAANFSALAIAINSGPAPQVRTLNPAVPDEVNAIVERALSRAPADRFQSAAGFAAALRAAASRLAEAPTSRGPRIRQRPGRGTAAAAALIVTLAAVSVPAYRLLTRRPAPAPRRTVLAVLPIVNAPGDAGADSVAAGIAAVLVNNLSAAPGLTLVSGAVTAPYREKRGDLQRIARDLDADAVADVSLQRAGDGRATVHASLARPGAASADWSGKFEGDLLTVERQLIESLAGALERAGSFERPLKAEDWQRLLRMPTADSAAMAEYSTARALLDQFEREGNLDRAVALFTSAVTRDPSFALAFAGLAEAHLARYRLRKEPAIAAAAVAAAEAALRVDPGQARVRTSLGAIKRLTGQPEQAIAEFRKALAIQPNDDDTHRQLGLTLAAQGKVDEGIAEVQRAIDIRPDYWNHHFTMGYVLYNASRYKDAVAAYRHTTELNPDYPGGYQMLGTAQHKLGDVEAAIGNYEHAVRLGPSAAAYSNLGYFYFSAARYREAVAAYSESVKRAPAEPLAHRNLADAYRRAGDPASARAEYARATETANAALRVNPRDATTISLLAICEARLGQASAAERHAAEAAAQPSADRDVFGRHAQVLALIGHTDRALAALRKAVKAGYAPSLKDDEFESLRGNHEFLGLLKAPGS